MSDSFSFTKDERVSHASLRDQASSFSLFVRLFASLDLFLRLFPLTLILIIAASASPSFFRWYAARFAAGGEGAEFLGVNLEFTAWGVAIVAGGSITLRTLCWIAFEISGMWSAQGVHAQMVRSMSRTRTTFFDENPSGRLINRLVRDFEDVRTTGIIFVGDCLNAMIEILSVSFLAFFASPIAGALVLPLFAIFFYIQYQRSGMLDHARNFAAVSTGNVLSRKNDLIEGRAIYLLYGRSEKLLKRIAQSFTEYVRASVLTAHIEVWGSFWMRLTAEFFSFGVLLAVAYSISEGTLSATLAGVIISALFGITGSIGWLDFATGYVSRSIPHVRRVFEFVDLETEESREGVPAHSAADGGEGVLRHSAAVEGAADGGEGVLQHSTADGDEGASGAGKGRLDFLDFTMSYRTDTPVILKGLNLSLPLGKKTALVGRTGSGKTSLFQSLLRMVHVRGGDIRIDGKSIYSLEIPDLRRYFGVVPQNPYLFAGTVASNLDRTGRIERGALADALTAVGSRFRLEDRVLEGGTNLSLGERQLICLARVIAADRKIILMDEPTSGLDPETDHRVQRVLETALSDRTILTIAHRLESISRYDRVVEMRDGVLHWEGPASEWMD